MQSLSHFEFVEAISFDNDGLSDTVLFKGKLAGLRDFHFKISNTSGSKENSSIDTIIITLGGAPAGLIYFNQKDQEKNVFLSRYDANNDGKIDAQDSGFLKQVLEIVLSDIDAINSYFGVPTQELK